MFPQRTLGEEWQKIIIATMGIEQDDLIEAVAPDLIQHPLDELQEKGGLDRDGAGKAACFVDLSELEGWKDYSRFFLGSQASHGVPRKVISAKRQVRAVPFYHAQGDDAHASVVHGLRKFIRSEVFPLHKGLLKG